jgi:hypothetical protein
MPAGISVIDTCAISRALADTKKHSLQVLVDHHGIERKGEAHRALSDVQACLDYWAIIKNRIAPAFVGFAWDHAFTAELPQAVIALPELVATGRPFHFGYTDEAGAQSDRTITPYGWAKKGEHVFFHGLCHLRNARRTFRADRVSA